MLEFFVLVPILLLLLAAIVSTAAPRLSEPARRWLTIVILALVALGALTNIAPSTHRLDVSSWDAAKFSITFQLDGIALVLLIAILVPLVALQLVRPAASLDSFAFYVLLSSALLICAGNLLTMVFAWAFLDLALFAWRSVRRLPHAAAMRALILGQLAGLALFAGAILLDAKQTHTGALLIALAFWARLGLFPFHWVLPSADLNTLELVAIRGAALAAGASLWLRWSELKADVPGELIALSASMTFIAAIVRIASEKEAVEKIASNLTYAIAFVPLAIAFGGDSGTALAFWVALSVVFALAMFELGLAWQSDAQNRWARLFFGAGILAAAGLPLTPAYLGRHGAYVKLFDNGLGFLGLLGACAAAWVLTPLWRISVSLHGADAREPTRREYAGLQLLGLAFVLYGFGAGLIALVTGESAERALDLVIRTDDFFTVALGLLALLAPIVISFFLARREEEYHPQANEIAQFLSRLLELEWLARGLTRFGEGLSALAKNFSALAEENPTVWILFIALWIAIFILTTR